MATSFLFVVNTCIFCCGKREYTKKNGTIVYFFCCRKREYEKKSYLCVVFFAVNASTQLAGPPNMIFWYSHLPQKKCTTYNMQIPYRLDGHCVVQPMRSAMSFVQLAWWSRSLQFRASGGLPHTLEKCIVRPPCGVRTMWCPWEGGSGNPPPSRAQLPFEHTDQGRGDEPKTKCFCVPGIMFCWQNMRFTPSGAFGTVCDFGSREVWDTSWEYRQTRKGLLNWDVDHAY